MAWPGQEFRFSSCVMELDDQRVDAYLVAIDPEGRIYSAQQLSPHVIVRGTVPFFTGMSGQISCRCQDLCTYTVCRNATPGTWTAIFAVLPAGATPRLENAITFSIQTVEVVPAESR